MDTKRTFIHTYIGYNGTIANSRRSKNPKPFINNHRLELSRAAASYEKNSNWPYIVL